MCTEEKKMIMGAVKKAETEVQTEKGAKNVEIKENNPADNVPKEALQNKAPEFSGKRTPMEFMMQNDYGDESASDDPEMNGDKPAMPDAEKTDSEETGGEMTETDPLDNADAVVFELPAINTVCPMITVIGARVAKIFDTEVEMGAFESDEDDLVIDILKRLYRAKMYVEGMELLDMVLSMIHCNEAIELADTAMQTLDDGCCKQFLESFICGSSRCDLEHLQKVIRKGR